MKAILLAVVAASCLVPHHTRASEDGWRVERIPRGLLIAKGPEVVAEFLVGDDAMRRPGLANLRAPYGTPITRAFPPREGVDATDHAAMHPGIWLAFGDVSGEDYWRNKARMEHERFVEEPEAAPDGVRFAAMARLRAGAGTPMGTIENRLAIVDRPEGRVVAWVATIRAGDAPLVLGDQEEMGFGVRLATGLEEKSGGRILNADGVTTAQDTWGRPAAWCDACGGATARPPGAGVTVVADPGNFRPSWWHNRDYGLVVANPFGRQALARGAPSRVTVAPGGELHLGFAAVLHDAPPGAPPHDAAAAAAAGVVVLRDRAAEKAPPR